MVEVLLVIHIIIIIGLVGLVLVQKSEGGGLGLGGGSSSLGGIMTSRGAANFLTKATAFFATAFMVNCIVLAIVTGVTMSSKNKSIIEEETEQQQQIDQQDAEPAAPTGD